MSPLRSLCATVAASALFGCFLAVPAGAATPGFYWGRTSQPGSARPQLPGAAPAPFSTSFTIKNDGRLQRRSTLARFRCAFRDGPGRLTASVPLRGLAAASTAHWSLTYRRRDRAGSAVRHWSVLEDRGRYTSDTTATGTLRVRLRLTVRGAFVNCRTPRIRWTATLQLPDLAVGLDGGGHFVVRNGGRADSGAFELRITLADGATNATQVPGLRAGRSLTLTAPCASGSALTADAASQVAEAREDNNTRQCS